MQPGTDVGLCDIVLDGDSVPQFSAYVYCGQTAGCIRIPLGTEASLGPGDIVLDGDLASPNLRGHSAPPYILIHVYCGQMVAQLSYW